MIHFLVNNPKLLTVLHTDGPGFQNLEKKINLYSSAEPRVCVIPLQMWGKWCPLLTKTVMPQTVWFKDQKNQGKHWEDQVITVVTPQAILPVTLKPAFVVIFFHSTSQRAKTDPNHYDLCLIDYFQLSASTSKKEQKQQQFAC